VRKYLMRLRVPDFAVRYDLANIVDRLLDGIGLTFFRSLRHQHRADHLGGCGVVKQQGLLGCRGHQDRRRHEEELQLFERLVCL
jgi:hypothetical protein